jgi:hypothetical protein
MRLGFSNPIAAVAKPVALAWFILSFPIAVRSALAYRQAGGASAETWTSSYAFLSLLGLALSAFFGRLVSLTGINAYPLIAAIGVVAFGAVLVRWIVAAPFWRSVLVLFLSSAFGCWAAGVVWGRVYKNPLFLENLILDGRVHHDTLHLAALANMLRNYHVASTGIDGIPYIPYHWGTPWLFAQWSNLTGARVIDFYQLGFPVTMIPFFFVGVLAFATELRSRRIGGSSDFFRTNLCLWLILFAACIGVIPLASLDAMGVWTSNYLISESYTVAVPAALMLAATAVAFYHHSARRLEDVGRRQATLQEWGFYVVFLPPATIALGYLKISLMMLALPVALYVFVRLRLCSQRPAVVSAMLLVVGCFLAYNRVSLPAHHEGFVRFDFMKTYVPFLWWPFFFLVHLAWSWLYIAFRLRQVGVKTLADIATRFGDKSLLDVEVVAVVALLGIAPGLLLHIDGGSAFYFSDVQRWLALGLILSLGPEFLRFIRLETPMTPAGAEQARTHHWRQLRTGTVVRWFIAAPMLITIFLNAAVWPARMVRANGETRRGLYALIVGGSLPAGIHAWMRLRDPAVIRTSLSGSPNYSMTTGLSSLANLDEASRSRTALFIPQDEVAYWTALTRPGACTYQSFLAPALSGMMMIDGMPAYRCTLSRYYGLGSFQPRTRPQTRADVQPSALCRRATRWGMTKVLIVTFDSSRTMRRSLVECRPGR